MTDFERYADIGVQMADKAMQTFYGDSKKADSAEDKHKVIRAMLISQASVVLGDAQPWQWMNLVHATCEYLTPDVYGVSGSYPALKDDILNGRAFKKLESVYPRAASWYKADVERLLSAETVAFDENGHRVDKDPLRVKWQNFRRGVLGDLSFSASERHVAIASSALLQTVMQETPWTALDILQASVEAYPAQGRYEFAKNNFFDSDALRQVQAECPEYSNFLCAKVNHLAVSERAPNSGPKPQA